MKALLTALLLVLVPAASGSTLVLSGVLHGYGTRGWETPANGANNGLALGPIAEGLEASKDGSFFLTFSGNTLNYSIFTRTPGTSFNPSEVGLMLGLPSGDLALPILDYALPGVSGCGLYFAAYAPLSYLTDSNVGFVSLGIYMPPGDCRAYFQFSMLTGSVVLTPHQAAFFSSPEFTINSSGLELYGRTNPNLIPEPGSFMLVIAAGLTLLNRRRAGRTVSSFILHPSSFLS